MTASLHPLRRAFALTCAMLVALAGMLIPGVGPRALAHEDPHLHQHVGANEDIAPPGTKVVFNHGHADLGPRIDEHGELRFLMRDDSEVHPVWRDLNDVTFAVGDPAKLALPDDPAYQFIGENPGTDVWVVPQTQQADTPWLGWSTQDPSLNDGITGGVTLRLLGHQGPGHHSLFLQSGGFAKPQVLWTDKDPKPVWAELGTHTHANWVFTQPGVHLVAIAVETTSASGAHQSIPVVLRFAVGVDPTSPEVANATWQGDLNAQADGTSAESTSSADKGSADASAAEASASGSNGSTVLWGAGIAVALVILLVIGVIVLRRNRTHAQRRTDALNQVASTSTDSSNV